MISTKHNKTQNTILLKTENRTEQKQKTHKAHQNAKHNRKINTTKH